VFQNVLGTAFVLRCTLVGGHGSLVYLMGDDSVAEDSAALGYSRTLQLVSAKRTTHLSNSQVRKIDMRHAFE
jgi:hypothetical protein